MMHSKYSNGEKKEGKGPWMWRCDSCLKLEKVNELKDYGFEITFSVPGMEYGRRHKFCKKCAGIFAHDLQIIADKLDAVASI